MQQAAYCAPDRKVIHWLHICRTGPLKQTPEMGGRTCTRIGKAANTSQQSAFTCTGIQILASLFHLQRV